jgi:hypothetical protein
VQNGKDNINIAGKYGRNRLSTRRLCRFLLLFRAIGQRKQRRGGRELGKRIAGGKPSTRSRDSDFGDLVFVWVERVDHRLCRTKRNIVLIRLSTEKHSDSDFARTARAQVLRLNHFCSFARRLWLADDLNFWVEVNPELVSHALLGCRDEL